LYFSCLPPEYVAYILESKIMSPSLQKLLEEIFQKWILQDIPNISKANTAFLREYIEKNTIRSVLEIGTAHGYSTLNFANVLQNIWGHIDTIEFSQPSYEIASEHIASSGLHNISQYFWDARDIIPHLDKKYDFVFIDGMKKASLQFFLLVWDKVHIWWSIIIDDVIKFRHKMEDLYEYVDSNNIEYEILQIDTDDGIMIIKKEQD